MSVQAVVFDLGSVLERIEPVSAWLEPWRERLGLGREAFGAALAPVDPDDQVGVGGLSEADLRAAYAEALGLDDDQADSFMADMWAWYCGTPDEELMAYARSLRPDLRTAILSNSADGARREEQGRYDLESWFDPIVYSHEVRLRKPDPRVYALTCDLLGLEPEQVALLDDVPVNVAAARAFGIHAVQHVSTPESITALDALLGR